MNANAPTPWHALPSTQVADQLGCASDQGLSASDAAQRLADHGSNRLAEKPPRPAWLKFLDQFRDTLALILLGAAVLAGNIGEIEALATEVQA